VEGQEQTTIPWSCLTRFAFRFALVYFIVYLLPFPLDEIPKLEVVTERYSELWQKAVPWVGRNILRLQNDITKFPGGSGDTTFHYVQLPCFFAIALVAAALWSLLDRNRLAYPRLYDWLRIYIRFSLGLTMFSYGIVKVMGTQFSYPDLDRFIQPMGHFSPVSLLWTFMGVSPAYCFFAGLAECLGGLLLLWRRTTTIGALIVAGVMANVVMLNFCYDVPVKLYSAHLLLLSLFLLLPDFRRLTDFFFLNRPTVPSPLGRPFANKWLNRAALVVKIAFVGWSVAFAVKDEIEAEAPVPALYGLYEVEFFSTSNPAGASKTKDENRWRRMVINRSDRLAVQLMDDSLKRYVVKDIPDEGKLELTLRWEPEKKSVLTYRKQDEYRLTLEGDFFGENLQILVRRIPNPQFLLPTRGFHWINERPFNR